MFYNCKNLIWLSTWFYFLRCFAVQFTNSKEFGFFELKLHIFTGWKPFPRFDWVHPIDYFLSENKMGKKCVCFYLMRELKSRNLHHPGCSDRSTYKTVSIHRAFTSGCTLYVTAVPRARPKTATVTLWCTHHLCHWETKENRLNRGHRHARVCVCVVVFDSLWCLKNGLDTHRSDTGPCLVPSSNLHRICDMDLRDGERSKWLKRIEETILKFGDV